MGHKPGEFPIAEAAASETLALPMYPELTEEQQRSVVVAIGNFFDAHASARVAQEKAA
jgi:dTDP-4-amino-4,6-dideoxygalactose transaminase